MGDTRRHVGYIVVVLGAGWQGGFPGIWTFQTLGRWVWFLFGALEAILVGFKSSFVPFFSLFVGLLWIFAHFKWLLVGFDEVFGDFKSLLAGFYLFLAELFWFFAGVKPLLVGFNLW